MPPRNSSGKTSTRGVRPARRRSIEANRVRVTHAIVGIDTGGTFTDLVAMVDGRVRVHKVLSTPDDPARAVFAGLKALLEEIAPALVTYSSTVATNALLERKGARVALFTDAGFEDLIEIGRQNRSELYALAPSRPEPLVVRSMRFGVGGRTLFDGRIPAPMTEANLKRVARIAARSSADSFAVCMLHSYANPRSEEAIARALAPLGRPLSVSNRLLAEYREFERLSTAVINAYVAPGMSGHLGNLARGFPRGALRVMQSNGSAVGAPIAEREPVRTILSGPAAGVAGAAVLGRAIGIDRFITFDMGGTSTDVALFDGAVALRTLSYPGGYAVRTPVIDIHTVGAGGGSIASVDSGGSMQVGPESAGANPGPACYGLGELPTVTDANLIAGRLVADRFLGGAMRIFPERATDAITRLGRAMRLGAADAARGVIRVVNANMERAIRVISVERGQDPRDFTLFAFGGAGPMHACELARDLGMRRIVLPRNPGLLCAWGALGAPLGREYSLTIREPAPDYRGLTARTRPMMERARRELIADGAKPSDIAGEFFLDMRYRGQSYEIPVRLTPDFASEFHEAHRRTFGHASSETSVEAVNIRLRAAARAETIEQARIARVKGKPAPIERIRVLTGDAARPVPVYARDDLGAEARIAGPAIIVELSATAYVAPDFMMRVDDFGNLHLEAR